MSEEQRFSKPSKNKQALTRDHEIKLWESGVVGTETAQCLSKTVFLYNCIAFGIVDGDEHRALRVSHFYFGEDKDHPTVLDKNGPGLKYVEFRGSASNSGNGITYIRQYDDIDNPNCVYKVLSNYMQQRKEAVIIAGVEDTKVTAFYLKPLNDSSTCTRYSTAPLGHDVLSTYIRTMMHEATIEGYFTNHSAKVMMATRLYYNGVSVERIKERTGYRDINTVKALPIPTEFQSPSKRVRTMVIDDNVAVSMFLDPPKPEYIGPPGKIRRTSLISQMPPNFIKYSEPTLSAVEQNILEIKANIKRDNSHLAQSEDKQKKTKRKKRMTVNNLLSSNNGIETKVEPKEELSKTFSDPIRTTNPICLLNYPTFYSLDGTILPTNGLQTTVQTTPTTPIILSNGNGILGMPPNLLENSLSLVCNSNNLAYFQPQSPIVQPSPATQSCETSSLSTEEAAKALQDLKRMDSVNSEKVSGPNSEQKQNNLPRMVQTFKVDADTGRVCEVVVTEAEPTSTSDTPSPSEEQNRSITECESKFTSTLAVQMNCSPTGQLGLSQDNQNNNNLRTSKLTLRNALLGNNELLQSKFQIRDITFELDAAVCEVLATQKGVIKMKVDYAYPN